MRVIGRFFGAVAALLVTFALIPALALSQNDGGPEFKSEDVINSTVRVVAYDSAKRRIGWGTGWIISATDANHRAGNAIVVTTWNTIRKTANGGYVQIIPGGGGAELPARIRSTKNETKVDFDLAFIEVKGLVAPAFKVAKSTPDSARPVYSTGYSFVSDTTEASQQSAKASIQSGTVSKIFEGGMTRASQAPVNQIEHNTPLDPGFSGGPLLDRCGHVVGVNTKDGGIRIGEDMPVALSKGSRFALAYDELISVANQEGVPFETASAGCSSASAIASTAPAPIATTPVKESFSQSVGHSVRENPLVLISILVVALGALAFGILRIMKSTKARQGGGSQASAEQSAGTPSSAPTAASTRVEPTGGTALVGPVIELSGRGHDGKALNFSFSASEVGKAGVSIGSDPARVGAFVDDRTDYKVSRLHARLGFDGKNFTLEDVKSTNGTKVSGAKLEPNQPRILVPGDDIELADVKLRVSIK